MSDPLDRVARERIGRVYEHLVQQGEAALYAEFLAGTMDALRAPWQPIGLREQPMFFTTLPAVSHHQYTDPPPVPPVLATISLLDLKE